MGEVIRVNFDSENSPEKKGIECNVVLNRPDLIELAMEGVKDRLIGEISYSKTGSVVVEDKICSEIQFHFETSQDMADFMNTYNNFVKDSDTFAFSVNGVVKINKEVYIPLSELRRNGLDVEKIESKGVKIHKGFLIANNNGVEDSYINGHDFSKLTA